MINYLDEFPISEAQLPSQLRELLTPIDSIEPDSMIKITIRSATETQNVVKEICHMTMATIPEEQLCSLNTVKISDGYVVAYSEPFCDYKGDLSNHSDSLAGFDYLVASWGDGSFYSYNLSEKVWMTLGLSQRCIGNSEQKIVYDDLKVPLKTVVEGHISNVFDWKPSRDILWKIRNDYLKKYLWMKGHVGVRLFFYEFVITETPEISGLMGGENQYELNSSWYKLTLQKHKGVLLLKVWANIIAIQSEKLLENDKHALIWPGDKEPMTELRVKQLEETSPASKIFFHDAFLEKYEKDSIYNTVPVISDDDTFYCRISYKGQWNFTHVKRIGRNIIEIPVYDLYKKGGIPDQEVLYVHKYAISRERAENFDLKEENIVLKTNRLINEMLELGELFRYLSLEIEMPPRRTEDYVGLSADKIRKNSWVDYPIISKLSAVAPLDMSESDFLERCKTLHELLSNIATGPLKGFLIKAGVSEEDLKPLKNLKLLEAIKNILDYLETEGELISSWSATATLCDWKAKNSTMSALYINADLRLASAHVLIDQCMKNLERLGFDSAHLSSGHGIALDFIFDEVIKSIRSINVSLKLIFMRDLISEYA